MKETTMTESTKSPWDHGPTTRRRRSRQILGNETVAVLGYGVQGRGQSLNMKDNGVNVIVGLRKGGKAGTSASQDGWVPGKTLFDPEEAAASGTIIQYLLSDAGQKEHVAEDQAAPDRRARRCTSRTASRSSTATRPASCRRRTST